MTVTIKDVAQAAGVSPATVSRVFNDTVPVDEETRARVLAAAESLRYVPNAAARSLITSRTATIGVLLSDLHGTLRGELLRGLGEAARRRGFDLLISSAHGDAEAALPALRTMRGRVDGVIVMMPGVPAADLLQEVPAGQPAVLLGSAPADAPAAIATIDEGAGAAAMVRHLILHGHRRIALLRGPGGDPALAPRVSGFREALGAAGLVPDPDAFIESEATEEGGWDAGLRLAELAPLPTAAMAISDAIAIGALAALRSSGISVPDDVAMAGFGDTPPARFTVPPLSTVRVPAFELGRLAIDRMLLAIARGGRTASRDVLECAVIPRASCGVHEA